VFTSDDGSKYTGEWKDDIQHGKGEMIRASGKVYNGDFVEGKRHGYGVCKFPDGSKYEGYWENDLQ